MKTYKILVAIILVCVFAAMQNTQSLAFAESEENK